MQNVYINNKKYFLDAVFSLNSKKYIIVDDGNIMSQDELQEFTNLEFYEINGNILNNVDVADKNNLVQTIINIVNSSVVMDCDIITNLTFNGNLDDVTKMSVQTKDLEKMRKLIRNNSFFNEVNTDFQSNISNELNEINNDNNVNVNVSEDKKIIIEEHLNKIYALIDEIKIHCDEIEKLN